MNNTQQKNHLNRDETRDIVAYTVRQKLKRLNVSPDYFMTFREGLLAQPHSPVLALDVTAYIPMDIRNELLLGDKPLNQTFIIPETTIHPEINVHIKSLVCLVRELHRLPLSLVESFTGLMKPSHSKSKSIHYHLQSEGKIMIKHMEKILSTTPSAKTLKRHIFLEGYELYHTTLQTDNQTESEKNKAIAKAALYQGMITADHYDSVYNVMHITELMVRTYHEQQNGFIADDALKSLEQFYNKTTRHKLSRNKNGIKNTAQYKGAISYISLLL